MGVMGGVVAGFRPAIRVTGKPGPARQLPEARAIEARRKASHGDAALRAQGFRTAIWAGSDREPAGSRSAAGSMLERNLVAGFGDWDLISFRTQRQECS